MTAQADMKRGWLLQLYLLLSHAFPLFAPSLLRKRLKRGKEDPNRWREKQGRSLCPRPDGTLIWLHAVGLGEVLSLRGLIARIAEQNTEVQFLVTSSTAASAQVFIKNLPPRTIHQFLPLDAASYRRRFLDHFQPDMCIWAEQDIWPGFVSDLAWRKVPQAVIAARMDTASFDKHRKAQGLYRNLYGAMTFVTAQDDRTARHMTALGAKVHAAISGSLKPGAPALHHDPVVLGQLRSAVSGRTVWAVAPSHPADEEAALKAHAALLKSDPTALLIIAPRYPDRRDDILNARSATPKLRSLGDVPSPDDSIWIFDTFGELGLVYRLADLVLIGGTFDDVEGHNPWEAAVLDTAITHGPRTGNFASDFAALDHANAAVQIATADDLLGVLTSTKNTQLTGNAQRLIADQSGRIDDLARKILDSLRPQNG